MSVTSSPDAAAAPSAPGDGRPPHPSELLRRTLRRQAAAVTVVTVPGPAGFTATSFTSASLEPALVSFYLGSSASTANAVRQAPGFAVHILGVGQVDLAKGFARSGVDRFDGVEWTPREGGVPVLSGVAAWLTAETVRVVDIGDHFLVVGRLREVGGQDAQSPLVHHDGTFGTFRAA